MSEVRAQYETFPYPARDPQDERKRLIRGSPSNPVEMDHFLFNGQRDWSKQIEILVAGGGTGDGLIQLAQMLTSADRPYHITYLDLSTASREIAEKRAQIRGLKGITFHTESLLKAADFGSFDYIDCCGVLHHLPDPDAGFSALRSALKPDGGLGLMVYAPYGRSGVYPLQEAYNALFGHLPPTEKLAAARAAHQTLSPMHPFQKNQNLVDHKDSDAGFYDLLLHSQDRAYTVAELADALERADLQLSALVKPAQYDVTRFAPRPVGMNDITAMNVAEKMAGNIKIHVAYARPKGSPAQVASGSSTQMIPHLSGPSSKVAQIVAKTGSVPIKGLDDKLSIPKQAAPLIAAINGKRNLGQIRTATQMDPIQFNTLWSEVEKPLIGWGLLHFSNITK